VKKSSKDGGEGQGQAELLIPRDGDTFAYVLEYLTYGKLITTELPVAIQEKLIIDADYFLLPELKEQALKAKGAVASSGILDTKTIGTRQVGQWTSNSGAAAGGYWNWNVEKLNRPPGAFTVSGNTITVTTAGVYQINIRVTNASATNGEYSALYLNGAIAAYSYSFASQGGIYCSAVINEILTLTAGARLQVHNSNRGAPVNDHNANSFGIVCLD